jgi:HPt (histidine-containing phosphotransfer) domain-containing protein
MAGDFLKELPERLNDIRRYHAENLWPELERAAHSLKGLCLMFGLQSLSAAFLAIEDAAEAQDTRQVQARLAGLSAQAESAARRLRDWLDNRPARPTA